MGKSQYDIGEFSINDESGKDTEITLGCLPVWDGLGTNTRNTASGSFILEVQPVHMPFNQSPQVTANQASLEDCSLLFSNYLASEITNGRHESSSIYFLRITKTCSSMSWFVSLGMWGLKGKKSKRIILRIYIILLKRFSCILTEILVKIIF